MLVCYLQKILCESKRMLKIPYCCNILCVRNLCDFALMRLIQVLCDLIFAIVAAAFPFSANLG